MKSSRPSSIIRFVGWAGLLLVLLSAGVPPAQAQTIQVEAADPPVALQGTVNLNVLIKGNGFQAGAVPRFFVTGTTDPGGITVRTTTFFNSTELVVNIDVAGGATIANFDIEVQNPDLRTGKGIELIAVIQPGSDPAPPGYVGFAFQSSPTGAWPWAVISADFNGDDVLDLATANSGDNTVSILLGNGDGTFGTTTDLATGLGPRGIVTADFDGDTRLDLATANNTDNSLSVLLGNGDGTFQAKRDLPSGTGPFAVVAADFNADDRTDLAAANRADNTISVLLGNGDGTFRSKMDFVTSTDPVSILVCDFNGDGKLDVATSNSMASTASVLLGNGDGTFGANMDSPTGPGLQSLTAVDFNLDGKFDLATANRSDFTASVFLGRGNGTFDPRTDLRTGSQPASVTASDFDNDGKPDLAVTSHTFSSCTCYRFCICTRVNPSLSLHLGHGDGTFGDRLNLTAGSVSSINWSQPPNRVAGAATGHFNADGRVDLAVVDPDLNQVHVLLQAPALSFNPGSLLFSNFQIVGTPTAPIDLAVSSTGSFSAVLGTVAISGTDAADFSIIAENCSGATVPVGSGCVISVMFTPSSLGAKSADLTITNNAAGNPHVVNLRGSGVPNEPLADLSATSANVGDYLVGSTQPSRLVANLTNIGGAIMNVSSITITGPNASDFRLSSGSNVCPTTAFALEPGSKCELRGTFTPGDLGPRSAAITITTDAAGSPHLVALSGSGVNISITPSPGSPSSRTIRAGQSAIFTLDFQAGSFGGNVTVTCAHSIPGGACIAPGFTAIPNTYDVTVTTTARALLPPLGSQRRLPPAGQPEIHRWVMAWLALALAVFLGWRRPARLRLSTAVVATVLLSVLLWSGCGGGSSALRGTPPGTYQVTVSASAGAGTQAQTIQLTVTVQ